jgi:hypothetical protein
MQALRNKVLKSARRGNWMGIVLCLVLRPDRNITRREVMEVPLVEYLVKYWFKREVEALWFDFVL